MTLLNLNATGPAQDGRNYTERLFLNTYHEAALAAWSLLMAAEMQTCSRDGRGWWHVPENLAHELWAREFSGRPVHVVARIGDNTLTIASDFAVTLPGHGLTRAVDSFTQDYRLITGGQPIRTSRLTHVTTPGGHLPARGA